MILYLNIVVYVLSPHQGGKFQMIGENFGFENDLKAYRNISILQSTLVISTSVISNNRLSGTENLIPVLT